MKRKIICVMIFFYITSLLFADTTDSLSGFWGINWKTSKDETKKQLLLKGCTIDFDEKEILGAKGVFAGKNTLILAKFYNDLLFSAVVFFEKESNKTFSNYDDIVALLTEKYGPPTDSTKYFESPYYWGDGYEEQALKLNKAIVFSDWNFKDGNRIRVALGNLLQPAIIYSNTVIEKQEDAVKREKVKGDL